MQVSGLHLYPVKSLRGFSVPSAALDELGFVGDRRFLVIDEQGRTLTQREFPQMALIETALTPSDLVLRSSDGSSLSVPLRAPGSATLVTVSVWGSKDLLADDCGPAPANWLSEKLRMPCRLVRIGEKFRRPVLNPERAVPGDLVSFADAYPFLILSEASVADLNRRLTDAGHEAVPINRFRPNIVVRDCPPHAEDTWPRFKIGEVIFRSGGACSRCPITTTDQFTGARGKEPLRTLATYRRDPQRTTEINFGQNLIHQTKTGRIAVGDSLVLL
jgi:uncharacterized protein YcbX